MNTNRIALVVDSCTDVPPEDIERYGMYVVPLQVNYANESYLDKVTISPQQVYDRFAEEVPTTSTPTPAVAREALERVIADGYSQVVIVTLSSGLSATHDLLRSVSSAMPELECHMVDSKNIGMGAGLVVLAVARLLEGGATFEEVCGATDRIVANTRVFFCVNTLDYLHKGGRIGEVAYRVGSLIDMRPVISCNEQGVYHTIAKAKGRRQSLTKAMDSVSQFAARFPRCTVAVVNGDAAEEALTVQSELEEKIENADAWYSGQISPVLVVHTGPGLLGIAVQGEGVATSGEDKGGFFSKMRAK